RAPADDFDHRGVPEGELARLQRPAQFAVQLGTEVRRPRRIRAVDDHVLPLAAQRLRQDLLRFIVEELRVSAVVRIARNAERRTQMEASPLVLEGLADYVSDPLDL